ncbi:MAG: hypothetical protein Kow0056_01500 [Coriobacteriia bacterium]
MEATDKPGACPHLPGCPVFETRMDRLPGIASLFRTRYCETAFDRCARRMAYETLGPGAVPAGLMPNDHEGLRRMMSSAPVG